MSTCAVISCPNVVKGNKKADTVLHCFPKDPVFAQKWITKCGRPPTFRTAKARICSDHFSSHNYERDLYNELRGLPTRKKGFLKETAVPDLCLPESIGEAVVQSHISSIRPGLLKHNVLSTFSREGSDDACLKKGEKGSCQKVVEKRFMEQGNNSVHVRKATNKNLSRRRMSRPSFKAGAVSCVERMEKEVKLFKEQSETLCEELEECKTKCRKGERELMRVKRREHLLTLRVRQLRMEISRLRKPQLQYTSPEGAGAGLVRSIETILQYGRKRASSSAEGTVLWGSYGVDVLYHR